MRIPCFFKGKLTLHTLLVMSELGILGNSTMNLRMATRGILRVLRRRKIREKALKGEREPPGKRERPPDHGEPVCL